MKGAPNYQAVPVAPYPNTTPAHLLPPGNRGPNTHAIYRQNPPRGGEWYQERSRLLKKAIADAAKSGKGAEWESLKAMQKILNDAAERSMPPHLQGKLRLANKDYAVLSDMQKHVHDPEAFVPPRLLSEATTGANPIINDLHIWDKIRSNQHASSLGASSVVGRAFQSSPRENIAAVLNSGAGTSLFDKLGLGLYNMGYPSRYGLLGLPARSGDTVGPMAGKYVMTNEVTNDPFFNARKKIEEAEEEIRKREEERKKGKK
jgi:hypothetical protein